MGRRPNQLVLEFFQRGRKLEDASNRYEHTCKKCGELFPKGRVDSLMAHLLRRCSKITEDDREHIFQYVQQEDRKAHVLRRSRPHQHDMINSLTTRGQEDNLPLQPDLQEMFQPNPERLFLPFQPEPPIASLNQQQSALDTLAEVSRRHLDYSSGNLIQHEIQNNDEHDDRQTFAEQALMAQLRHANAMNIGVPVHADRSGSFGLDLGEPRPGSKQGAPVSSQSSVGPPLIESTTATHEQMVLPHSWEREAGGAPSLSLGHPIGTRETHVHYDQSQSLSQGPMEITRDMRWNSTAPNVEQSFSSLATTFDHPQLGFGSIERTKSKPRGRFTDDRRKEVKEIRKRGACIRCRMLKKPCSEGTPCNTCRNVETARLWKGKCLRTRLADEFTLWSTGYYETLAKHKVPHAIHGLEQLALPGRLEVRLLSEYNQCLTFAVKHCSKMTDMIHRTDSEPKSNSNENDVGATNMWCLDEGDNMSDKIETYINCALPFCRADTPFMSATLGKARQHIAVEQDQNLDGAQANTKRSCYSLQSQLLVNCIELWLETQIICSPQNLDMTLRYVALSPPLRQPQQPCISGATEILPNSISYNLIKSQLLAAVESRCGRLAKNVMNELERRLLQRQQTSRFATFLSAVILLSCIEHMAGLYHELDPDQRLPASLPEDVENLSSKSTTNAPGDWPLAQSPSHLWSQGEHFADLLTMLLRMRGLPPRTVQHPDDTLAVYQDLHLYLDGNVTNAKQQLDEQTRAAAEWLDPLRLSVSEMMAKRDGPLPGADAGLEAWDMRFIAKVLLPAASTK